MYFRLNAHSHHVELIGDRMQNPWCAPCRITASRLDRLPYSVCVDLTPAYTLGTERLAARVEREISLNLFDTAMRVRRNVAVESRRVTRSGA